MDFSIPLLYDIAIAVMVLCTISRCWKQGFASSIVHFIGTILSFVAATVGSTILSGAAYQTFFRPKVLETVRQTIAPENLTAGVNDYLSKVPEVLSNTIGFFFGSSQNVADKIGSYAAEGTDSLAVAMADQVVAPMMISLLKVLLFFILFAICMFFTRRLAGLFRKLNRVPLLGTLNGLLGGAVGAAEGLIIAALITIGLSALIILTGGKISFLPADFPEKSIVFHLMETIKLNFVDFTMTYGRFA